MQNKAASIASASALIEMTLRIMTGRVIRFPGKHQKIGCVHTRSSRKVSLKTTLNSINAAEPESPLLSSPAAVSHQPWKWLRLTRLTTQDHLRYTHWPFAAGPPSLQMPSMTLGKGGGVRPDSASPIRLRFAQDSF